MKGTTKTTKNEVHDTKVVQEIFDNDILAEEEFKAMTSAEDTVPGRFYVTFKVHQHENGKASPIQGIVSCSGSFTENIALYVKNI